MRSVALCALLALAACSRGKGYLTVDELDPDVPHRPLEAACAEFDPPDAEGAFVFAADIFDETTGEADGTLHVAVQPGKFRDAPAWFVEEVWVDSGNGRPAGVRERKHARTWLAPDLTILSAVIDVDTTRPDASVERLRSELGPTERGYWMKTTRADGSTDREESTSAGPSWARSFAGAMVFARRCAGDSALYPAARGDYLSVRAADDGTMTVSGFASMSVTLRAADRAPLSLTEHVWELNPRRFQIRATPR
jgi:hypothetical protein